jgi:hypothetical protein
MHATDGSGAWCVATAVMYAWALVVRSVHDERSFTVRAMALISHPAAGCDMICSAELLYASAAAHLCDEKVHDQPVHVLL